MSNKHNPRAQAAARRALAPAVLDGTATCWRCGLPILPGQEWDAGHTHDLGLGGHPLGETRHEHARKKDCPEGGNRSNGARLGAQLRPRGRRRLDEWISRAIERPGFFRGGVSRYPEIASFFSRLDREFSRIAPNLDTTRRLGIQP